MANTRFGNFSNLSQGKKPISDEEALAILTNLGFIGQEFIPGATSIRKVMEGKPREAVEELQDWIPGNAAYQNWLNDKPQDWTRNAIDAMIMGKPITKGAKKAFEAIERIPKGGKEGFLNVLPIKNEQGKNYLTKATSSEELKILNDGVDIAKEKKIISAEDAEKLKNNFNSTYENDKRKELAVNMGIIDPKIKTSAAMKPLEVEDISPNYIEAYKKAKEVGEKNRIITKDEGNFEGLKYYTKYNNDSPLLYAEDRLDANIARHNFSNYDDVNEKINKEIREALPGENNRIAPIFDKDYKAHNPYKTIVEPAVFDKFKVINNIKASGKSLNKAKEELKTLDEYVLPDEFYKIILGL